MKYGRRVSPRTVNERLATRGFMPHERTNWAGQPLISQKRGSYKWWYFGKDTKSAAQKIKKLAKSIQRRLRDMPPGHGADELARMMSSRGVGVRGEYRADSKKMKRRALRRALRAG